MEHLIRFVQMHESFREAEIEALSQLSGVKVETLSYSNASPFCTVRFPNSQGSDSGPRSFISRSVLSKGIYELWGSGVTYDALHADIKRRSSHLWPEYLHSSFKFSVDAYLGKRTEAQQKQIIESFRYMGFRGKVCMKKPDAEFVIFEEWQIDNSIHGEGKQDCLFTGNDQLQPRRIIRLLLGRQIALSPRYLIDKHDLKKRPYISTTSMDAALALVTANLALAESGKLFLDPFVGTGGFMVAAAELGAVVIGSDIDGRSFRGNGRGVEQGVGANFRKYGLQGMFGDCIISDLTNTPLRSARLRCASDAMSNAGDGLAASRTACSQSWLDGIVCDPPYGVREGLKVLGTRSTMEAPNTPDMVMIDGVPAYTLPGYIAPKKPYSFIRMLDDILDFAARNLVTNGRLAFWMPTANDEEDIAIPQHPCLEHLHCCTQAFNKWSRRLLVYQRNETSWTRMHDVHVSNFVGNNANELNPFRRKYFRGFEAA